MLPKTSAYVKGYDGETKSIYFSIEDGDLLNEYNNIWNKVSNSIKKELDSEPIYNKILLKTKRKFDGDDAKDFYDNEILKISST